MSRSFRQVARSNTANCISGHRILPSVQDNSRGIYLCIHLAGAKTQYIRTTVAILRNRVPLLTWEHNWSPTCFVGHTKPPANVRIEHVRKEPLVNWKQRQGSSPPAPRLITPREEKVEHSNLWRGWETMRRVNAMYLAVSPMTVRYE